MNLSEAKSEVKRLLSGVDPPQLPVLLHWIRTAGDERKGPECACLKMIMQVIYKAEKAIVCFYNDVTRLDDVTNLSFRSFLLSCCFKTREQN